MKNNQIRQQELYKEYINKSLRDVLKGHIPSAQPKELVDLFMRKYHIDILKSEIANSEEMYLAVETDLEVLKSKLMPDVSAVSKLGLCLSQSIFDYDDKYDTYSGMRWFLAAISKCAVEYSINNGEMFKNSFCAIDSSRGLAQKFCRLIIISAIEFEYGVKNFTLYDYHKDIFRIDGRLEYLISDFSQASFLEYLWIQVWGKYNISRSIEAYEHYLGGKSKRLSAYHQAINGWHEK